MAAPNGSSARSGESAWTTSWSWAQHTCAGSSLVNYYNELRTHRFLTKDTPPHRAVSWLELAQWDAQINLQLAQILAARSALGLGFDFVLEVQLDAEG
jgi:hypothetical protein